MTKQITVGVMDANHSNGLVKISNDYLEHMAILGFTPTNLNFYTGFSLDTDPYGPVGFIGPCDNWSDGGSEMMQIHAWSRLKFASWYEVLAVWLLHRSDLGPRLRTLSSYLS